MSLVAVHRYAKPGMASVNTYWVETDRSLIVVDGQRALSAAREARAMMATLAKPIAAVFLTHPHPDHFGGIGVFAPEGAGIPVYGSAQTRESIRDDRWGLIEASRQVVGEDFPPEVRVPDHVLADGQAVEIDGVTIMPGEMGGGEAECMTVLHIPSAHILFAADVIQDRMTAFLLEARLQAWLGQLAALGIRYPDVETIYPGHGEPGPARELIDRQVAYLTSFGEALARADDPAAAADVMRQRFPGYQPVAAIPDLLDQDAAAMAKARSAG